jgi:hypothetical protein
MSVVLTVVVLLTIAGSSSPAEPGHADVPPYRIEKPFIGTTVSWTLPIGEFSASAVDLRSHSIALLDYGVQQGEMNRVEVVDARRGFVRWRRQADASWLVQEDGKLAATPDGTAFLVTTSSPATPRAWPPERVLLA